MEERKREAGRAAECDRAAGGRDLSSLRSIDTDLAASLAAFASLEEDWAKLGQERPDRERESARRTSQARGRPGTDAAGTASAADGSPSAK